MIAMIRKFLDLAGERKKQLYLAWLFQALTSICEGAIYFMLFLAIKDILGGSFTREKLIQYSLMFLVYTVLHFVFYYFTIAFAASSPSIEIIAIPAGTEMVALSEEITLVATT